MKKTLLSIIALLLLAPAFAQYTVTGGTGEPLLAEDNTSNRIRVYLLNGLTGAEIAFQTEQEEPHQWYKYNTRYSEAVPIASQQSGNRSTMSDIDDGWAYFVESPSYPTPSFVWMIDYSRYQPVFTSLEIQEEEEDRCEVLKLIVRMEAEQMIYYTYSGIRVPLPRTYHLLYDNLEWQEESLSFIPKQENRLQSGILSEIIIDPAPLTNTAFTLIGDDFAKYFGMEQRIATPEYAAIAVEAHAQMIVTTATGEIEEIKEAGAQTAYSAPVDIRFQAQANEPVAAWYAWNILKTDPETKEQTSSLYQTLQSVSYTFRESGIYTAQLEVRDTRSACFDYSYYFTLSIGDSDLRLPNAFSPGSSPGVNDEYRVSYKSLVSFKASIYNRWGNLLYHWEDPAQGWDGKVNGRYVPTGVYFIVVEAKGADGKEYRLSKDINILRVKE